MSILLGEWGFLDNLADSSGNNLDANANFSPTYVDGPQTDTRAIRFSDAGQSIIYGRAGLEPAANGVTSMAWARLSSAVYGYLGVLKHPRDLAGSTRHGMAFFDLQMFAVARWADDLNFGNYSSGLNDNSWHHMAVVDGPNEWAFYLDGVVVASGVRALPSATTWEPYDWFSGFGGGDMQSHPDLSVSGVRIFDGELTSQEVSTWMNTPIVGEGGSPVSVWDGAVEIPANVTLWNGTAEEPVSISVN